MKQVNPQIGEFGSKTADFVCQALGAEWGCFYQIDAHGQPFDFQVHRAPEALRTAYVQRNMHEIDPLHPSCLAGTALRFVSVHDPRLPCTAEHRRNYWQFLCAFGSRDSAEMIFRVGGQAAAGLSLIWTGKAGASLERERGEAVHAYVEFNLGAHFSRFLPKVGGSLAAENLTDREREIAELVCRGSTNAQIAQRLGIGIATVKTHLIHIFEKCGVGTRAALVSHVLAPPSGPRGPH